MADLFDQFQGAAGDQYDAYLKSQQAAPSDTTASGDQYDRFVKAQGDTTSTTPTPASPAAPVPVAEPRVPFLTRVGRAARDMVVPTTEDQLRYGGMPVLGAETGPLSRLLRAAVEPVVKTAAIPLTALEGEPVAQVGRGGVIPQNAGQPMHTGLTGRQAAFNALQAGITLAGGPAESKLEAGLLKTVPGTAARGLSALDRLAAKGVARVGFGAGAGAAYSPDDPAVGATLGGAAGALPTGVEAGQMAREAAAAHPVGMPGVVAETLVPGLRENRRSLERTANTDPKTGIANDRAYAQALPTAEADPNTVIIRFDLNGFKATNDAIGHAAGDDLLRQAADAVHTAATEHGAPDRAFRVGGDELAAIVPADVAESIRDRAEALYGVKDHAPGVRSSLSGGIGPTDAEADAATYTRKAVHRAAQGIAPSRPVTSSLAPDEPASQVGGDATSPPPRLGLPVVGAPEQVPPVAPAPAPPVPTTERGAPARVVRSAGEPLGGSPERAQPVAVPAADVTPTYQEHLQAHPDDRIAKAAIRTPDGRLFVGSAHGPVLERMEASGAIDRATLDAFEPGGAYPPGLDIGFVTHGGTFVLKYPRPSVVPDAPAQPANAAPAEPPSTPTPEAPAEPALPSWVTEHEPAVPEPGDRVPIRDAQGRLRRNLTDVHDDDLVGEIGQIGSRVGQSGGQVPWVRFDDDVSAVVSGHTRGMGAVQSQQKAIARIDAELKRRGWTDADIGQRLAELSGDPEYRYAGPGVTPRAARRVRDVVRSAVQGPYAALEGTHDALKEAANQVGASRQYADYLATQGVRYATEGMTPEQTTQFTQRLVADNLEAVAESHRQNAARLRAEADAHPEQAADFHADADQAETNASTVQAHADRLLSDLPPNVEAAPWFQTALQQYKTHLERPLEEAAGQAGVANLRQPRLGAYIKLLAVDPETGTPITGPGATTPRALNPRTLKSISAKQATGLAPRYSDVLEDIVRSQSEKVTKAARNRVFQEVAKIGQPLGPREPAPDGMVAVGFDDNGHVVPPVGSKHRYAVPRAVGQALAHLQKVSVGRATTPFAESKVGRAITGASLALSPGEAPYHASAEANVVGRVPGSGVLDELPALVPVLGPRIQGVARVLSVNLDHPETRALEARLAKAGALRAPDPSKLDNVPALVRPLVRANHALRDLLFGPRGFDRRARLWLADRYLKEHPTATDEQLRVFVTDKVGNYVKENSGELVNALQDIGLTSYARFAVPSIRNAVRSSVGGSGLGGRPGPVARQVGRGIIGTAAGIAAYNVLASGHSPLENEPGHRQDVDVTRQVNAARALFGKPPITEPVYAKLSALDPQASRALRATGMSAVLNGGSAPDMAREVVNTNVLALASPALRVASNLTLGKDPYVTQGGDLFQSATPGYTGQQTMRNRLTAALTGVGGSLEAAFGGGNPRAEPFGPVSRVTNAVMPQLFATGTGRPNDVSEAIGSNREFDAAFSASLRRVREAPPKDRARVADEEAQKAAEGGANPGLVKALLLSRAASPDAIYGIRQTIKAKVRKAQPR